ncbi:MAG: glycosyl hydrolase [Chthonomonadales bacterium]
MTRRLLTLAFLIFPIISSQAQNVDDLARGFANVPKAYRMKMFWRIFGPSLDKDEIDYQFKLMRGAGLGGVMTFFTYPIGLDNPEKGTKNEQFLSPAMLNMFGYAASAARREGLRFGVAGGTGWPYGGPSVSLEDSAQRIRRVEVASTDIFRKLELKPNEKVFAWYSRDKGILQVIPSLSLSSQDKFYAAIIGPTLMKVKRPSLGAEGYVVSHYNRAALERYLAAVPEKLISATNGNIQSIFCDSLEVYGSNWTPELPEEFKKRRGYDLIENLPALFEDERPSAPQVRFDFWRTLAELHEEHFTKPLGEWCRKHHVQLEMEEYGTPPAPLTAYQHIDVPTGEQYEWQGFSFSRYPASGAHLAGKRKVGAEAWTWMGIPNRLADTLTDFKLGSDYHFGSGINELTGVDWAYSPRNAAFPGWLPYYGPVMNQNNSLFPYFHYLVEYVNRCQFLLQQGKPVAEVALYLPVEDCFSKSSTDQMPLDFLLRDHFATGKLTPEFGLKNASDHHSNVIHSLITNGYNFDGIDFWTLNRSAIIKNGRITCGDGDYGIVLLHKVKTIESNALQRLFEFVQQGGKLLVTGFEPSEIAQHGSISPDLLNKMTFMFGTISDQTHSNVRYLGKGSVTFVDNEGEKEIAIALKVMTGAHDPDVITLPNLSNVAFIHRQTPKSDIFFLSNTYDGSSRFVAQIKTRLKYVTELNPVTGKAIRRTAVRNANSIYQSVRMTLPRKGSTFLIASKDPFPGAIAEQSKSVEEIEMDTLKWNVTFAGENPPAPYQTVSLTSWTEWPGAKYYSGTAIYRTTFAWSGKGPSFAELQFGAVHDSADVWINGKLVGGTWCPPYSIDITRAVKPGANTLEVRVGNVMANRYIGMPREDFKALRAVYGNRFPDPEEKDVMKEPAPSGLFGHVVLNVVR